MTVRRVVAAADRITATLAEGPAALATDARLGRSLALAVGVDLLLIAALVFDMTVKPLS